jgi:hypothetical protein
MPTAENDHSVAVPKQGTELVVHTPRADVQRQQLPEDPSRECALTGECAHRIFELRDERDIGQDHLGDGRCECRHGVIVVGKTDVDHEDGVRPTPAEEPREARDILPRPIPHERVHGEWQPFRHRALGGQNVDLGAVSRQGLREMKGMIGLGQRGRREGAGDDDDLHCWAFPRIQSHCSSHRSSSVSRAPPVRR